MRRRIAKVFLWIILLLVVLFVALMFLLRTSWFQTQVTSWAMNGLKDSIGTEVSIGSVDIHSFSSGKLNTVLVRDLHNDTLLFVEELEVEGFDWSDSDFRASKVMLSNVRTKINTYPGETISDLAQLIKIWNSKPSNSEAKIIAVDEVLIVDHTLSIFNADKEKKQDMIDPADLFIDSPTLSASGLWVKGDSIRVNVDDLAMNEKSGLLVRKFMGELIYSPKQISATGLDIQLAQSSIKGDLQTTQDSISAFKDFASAVNLRANFSSSTVYLSDLDFLRSEKSNGDMSVDLEGRLRGTLADLKGRDLDVNLDGRTAFKGNMDIIGLPDFKNAFMIVDAERFSTDRSHIASLPFPGIQKNPSKAVPPFLQRFGKVGFSGNYTGFLGSFTATGDFSTALGRLNTDMSFQRDTLTGKIKLKGDMNTKSFQLWKALGQENEGFLACDLEVDLEGRDLDDFKARLNGDIHHLDVGSESFEKISVKGVLEDRVFNGLVISDDDDLQFEFEGLADIRGAYPIVDFSSYIYHIDPHKIGLDSLPEGSSISGHVEAEGIIAPDSINGSVRVRNLLYCEGDTEYDLGNAAISSTKLNGEPLLTVEASLFDARIQGTTIPREIPIVARQVLFSIFPSLSHGERADFRDQKMTALITLKETDRLLPFLVPDLSISPGTQVQIDLDSRSLLLDAQLRSEELRYGDAHLHDVEVRIDKTFDVITFAANASKSAINDSVFISDVSVRGKAYQDDVDLGIDWLGSSKGSNGNLDMVASVQGERKAVLRFLPSRMFFGRGNWEIRDTSEIMVDSTSFAFDDFKLWNDDQLVRLNGSIDRDPEKKLEFEMQNVDIDNVNLFLKGPEWSGVFNGTGSVTDLYGKTELLTDARVDSLMIDEDLIGDVTFGGKWNERRQRIDMQGKVERAGIEAIDFKGWYRPKDNNAISLTIDADRFDLAFLDSYIPAGLSNIEGRVSGNIYLDGSTEDPLLNGEVLLEDAQVGVDFLGTAYRFTTPVVIYPDMFASTGPVVLKDKHGNEGVASIQLTHQALKDFSYDIGVNMKEMLCFDTKAGDNDLFYGTAFGSGDVSVSGYAKKLFIDVNAKTERGTKISFPLGDGATVSSYDFVEFIQKDTVSGSGKDEAGLELDLAMDIEVTPDAFVELIFDPVVGDIMSGQGAGNIELSMKPTGEFTMFGGVDVQKGEYLFTLRNLINKRFRVDAGGRVSWFGDPYNARLDLKSVYDLRAPLYDIVYDANESYRKRVPVEVVMELTENMLDPSINFDVRLPTVDESVRTQVNSVLSTEQEMNRQVFSLLVLNKFSPPAGFASESFAGATGSELLSNQVSNWLGGISDNLDLGVNYRAGDQVAQDQLQVAVGTQLFSERLRLNTNLGVQYGDRAGVENNSFIGDFELEYLLTDDGKLRLEAFSQSNDQNLNLNDQANTTQGVGLGFKEDFDSWDQLWDSIKGLFRKKKQVQ